MGRSNAISCLSACLVAMGATSARAEHFARDCGEPVPKVIVHMQEPEIVYESAAGCAPRKTLLKHGHKVGAAPASTITAASVITPLAFTSGFASQGFALNGLSLQGGGAQVFGLNPQVFSLGTQNAGLQAFPGGDMAELRAAQELELMAARMSSLQAARSAETRAFGASVQRIRGSLNGISVQGVAPQGANGAETDCAVLKREIEAIRTTLAGVESTLKEIKEGLAKPK